MILFLISFVGGVLTVLAPCILPLLPVIVGGSMTDGKINTRKSLTIVISLGISVILFTLLLKVSTLFIHIPEYTWTLISGSIILILGIITVFPSIWENPLLAKFSAKSNMLLGRGDQKKSFWGDVIVGAALGPVFSSCSPTYFIVLATVLPVKPALGIIYLLAYTVGLCLSLLLVGFIGQKIMGKLDVAANPRGTFKRVLGVIFIIVGIAILTGFDKTTESAITGAGFFDVTKIEQKLLQHNTDSSPSTDTNTSPVVESNNNTDTTTAAPEKPKTSHLTIEQKDKKYKKVPELSTIDGYINTDGKPITLASLRGKVVLLDIWTYSCINCKRTIPYINNWYAKYKDQGFEVVGLHTPEFGFEKVQANVEKGVRDLGIKYPVVLDNDYSTWNALGNQYWPRKYLIDTDGYIIYDHIGEGDYDKTETAIQNALKERADKLGMSDTNISKAITTPKDVIFFEENKVDSPEVYFGSARNEYFANGKAGASGQQSLTIPTDTSLNHLYLSGTWNIGYESAELISAGSIVFPYDAKNVYMVASSAAGTLVEIYQDDVLVKTITIKDEKLYTLIEGANYGKHTLKIKIPNGSLTAFTFTFG